MRWTVWMGLGSLLCGISVALGAFGAHALRSRLSERMLETFEVGVRYQMFHAFALMVLALLATRIELKYFSFIASSFLVGIILFSGSLYAIVFSSYRSLGMITPLGGVALIIAWLTLAISLFRL